jgi:hypothetical protein
MLTANRNSNLINNVAYAFCFSTLKRHIVSWAKIKNAPADLSLRSAQDAVALKINLAKTSIYHLPGCNQ